jgi:hypothetical protein
VVAVAVFSIVYMASKSPLGRVLVAGFHRGGGFQPRDKKAARGRTGFIGFGLRFPSRAALFGPIASGESVQFPNNRYSNIPIDSEITAGSVFTRFIETI